MECVMPKFTDLKQTKNKAQLHRHTELICELGSNHNGDFERAKSLAHTACSCGADTIKIQLFEADKLWRKGHPRHAETLKVETKPAWIPELKSIVEGHKKEFLCTPFSPSAVETLEKAGVKRYKISSGDVTYKPLLEEVAKTGKPVLLSVGFSTLAEIEKAIERLRPTGRCDDLTLLWCVGDYPTLPERANYPAILDLIQEFTMKYNTGIGLSSHLKDWWLDLIPLGYNISVIEKHFDLSDGAGVEWGHSLSPHDFAVFAQAVRNTEKALTRYDWPAPEDDETRRLCRRDPRDWLRPEREYK